MPEGRATIHLPFARPPEVAPPEPTPEHETERAQTDQPAAPSDTACAEDSEPVEFTIQDEQAPPLWPSDEGQKLTRRWERAQDAFIDAPRDAMKEVDSLLALVATRIPEMFAAERARLEGQWDQGGEAPAEDLRMALLRYRSFFGRLLAV